jgi:pimeloyl-ACP methyl ester carboxylesterase
VEVVDWPDGTVASLVDFATALVDEDTVLFGHSMNATLVLAVAAQAACRGVIAVAPATQLPPDVDGTRAFWDTTAEPERKQRADAIRAEFDTADDADKPMLYVRYNNLRYFYDLDRPPPTPEEMTVAGDWSQQVMASGAAVDWPATFDAVTVPVLLALGDHDFLAPPPLWLNNPTRPGWTTELFEQSGHAPYVEHPDAFVAAVRRWL